MHWISADNLSKFCFFSGSVVYSSRHLIDWGLGPVGVEDGVRAAEFEDRKKLHQTMYSICKKTCQLKTSRKIKEMIHL